MPDEFPIGRAGARDPRVVRWRDEPDRSAADDVPGGGPEGGRALELSAGARTRRGVGRRRSTERCARRRPVTAGEVAIFEESHEGDPIDLVAEGDTRFVIGSAAKHPARARARQLLGAHEHRGAAPRRGGDPPHRPAAARGRNAAAADVTPARAKPTSPERSGRPQRVDPRVIWRPGQDPNPQTATPAPPKRVPIQDGMAVGPNRCDITPEDITAPLFGR